MAMFLAGTKWALSPQVALDMTSTLGARSAAAYMGVLPPFLVRVPELMNFTGSAFAEGHKFVVV
jgi:hypothetical protein